MFLIEVNCSFPLSKIVHNYARLLYLVFKMWMGTLFRSREYTKEPNKIAEKCGNEKLLSAERNCSLLIKGRFKHILNIFKQRPSWCPLIHPSSSTFCAGSCYSRAPIQKGGPDAFPQRPTFLGDTGLSRVNSNFQPPICKYNNIFIKVLQGHPGKNQTTTKGNVLGPEHSSSSLFLATFPSCVVQRGGQLGTHRRVPWRKHSEKTKPNVPMLAQRSLRHRTEEQVEAS